MQLYQTQELIIICVPVTDVALYSSEREVTSAGHEKYRVDIYTFKINKF